MAQLTVDGKPCRSTMLRPHAYGHRNPCGYWCSAELRSILLSVHGMSKSKGNSIDDLRTERVKKHFCVVSNEVRTKAGEGA